ncbi:DegT/DnrJ/EryC1/StrS aminotransferase family protein [Candidatus Saccharibacteria bacterium]|nr:DegT/DnrJ/EryC1/StrS aminotransferase family protein [Candidatus Saccharibacteria bacterium]
MGKHYFLGLAAGRKESSKQLFTHGTKEDCVKLSEFLKKKYGGEVMLTKNGRSALALALKAYFDRGDKIIVNGFTCYAVYEAIKAAGLTPIWADISEGDLNYDAKTLRGLEALYLGHAPGRSPKSTVPNRVPSSPSDIKGIIIQNSLGNPVDIGAVEKFARKHSLIIIEDLAHSVGVKYADGREAGTVGSATILSFGKDKAIDTISGGALILRKAIKNSIKAPSKRPRVSDTLRSRFYPLFGAICRGLSYIHLGGPLMRLLVKIHFVEKSADNKLDLNCRINKFEAKLALRQLKKLNSRGEKPLREFYLVNNREEVLSKLRKAGYFFDGFWYERPVSPERYYKKVNFPEEACPVATEVAKRIVNLPTYYNKKELAKAREIIKEYL